MSPALTSPSRVWALRVDSLTWGSCFVNAVCDARGPRSRVKLERSVGPESASLRSPVQGWFAAVASPNPLAPSAGLCDCNKTPAVPQLRTLSQSHHDRRLFTVAAAAFIVGMMIEGDASEAADAASTWRPGDRILFQGDSITDAHRGRESAPDAGLGHGYAYLVAARLSADHPGLRLALGNRGVTGNKIHELAGRWQEDTIALRPDMLSILVGVNDTTADMPFEEFEAAYDALLEQTKAALPKVRLVLCEPFALLPRGADGSAHGWETNVRERARIVEKLATKYRAPFVRFQKVFDAARERAPAEYWLYDGIHPTHPGHQLMADEWIRTVTAFYR